MTTGEACLLVFLLLILLAEIVWISHMVIKYRREEKERQAKDEERERQKIKWFYASAQHSKTEADKHGIEYAFGKAECDEREKIEKAINHQSRRGLYACELDFPISPRSVEWLKHSGFEVSPGDGKITVSWEAPIKSKEI